jgi:antitoxin ParD1/3/4
LRIAAVTASGPAGRAASQQGLNKLANFANLFRRSLAMATMNVSIPDAMKDWVEERVASGSYANASDYVRDLIRRDHERREALAQALIEGENSGVSRRKLRDIANATRSKLRHGTR